MLAADEGARLGKMLSPAAGGQYLAAHVLLRHALSQYAPIPASAWRFVVNAHGRPAIDPSCGVTLGFSLSHTAGLVACLVGESREIGVDVELLGRRGAGLRLAERFFAPKEVEALRAARAPEREARFLELWTLKEAYVKARGLGLALPLKTFAFTRCGDEINIEMEAACADVPAGWSFTLRRLASGHVVATALRASSGLAVSIEVISDEDVARVLGRSD